MDTLILLRHAKASSEAADDRARPLARRGREEAREAGAAMAAQGLRAERALVSPAARTRETWALVSESLADPPVDYRDALYMADAETIWAEAAHAAARRVIVVGHNPGLHELAVMLIERAGDRSKPARAIIEKLPPASWLAFAVAGGDLAGGRGRLIAAWTPKIA